MRETIIDINLSWKNASLAPAVTDGGGAALGQSITLTPFRRHSDGGGGSVGRAAHGQVSGLPGGGGAWGYSAFPLAGNGAGGAVLVEYRGRSSRRMHMDKRCPRFAMPFVAAAVIAIGICAPAPCGAQEYFLKGSGPTVYAVHEGRRSPIPSPECFVAVAGRRARSEIQTVPDANLLAIPEGPPVICDHTFVKFADSPAVYMSQGNTLRWLNDPPCAFANGVAPDWHNVVHIDPRWRASFAFGNGVCAPGGVRFVKGSRATVYSVAAGERHPIPTAACFVAIGGAPTFSDVENLPDEVVNAMPEGVPVVCEHSFVKFSRTPTIFVSVGNTLRRLNDPSCAIANGVAPDNSNVQGSHGRFASSFAYGRSMCPGAAPAPPFAFNATAGPVSVVVGAPSPPPVYLAPAPVVAMPAPVIVAPVVQRDCGTGPDPGCNQSRDGAYPMDAATYRGLLESARATANEITKSEMIITSLGSQYVTARQFVAFLDLFRNELTKMDVARAAAPKVVDPSRALSYGPRIVNSITRQEFVELIGQQQVQP